MLFKQKISKLIIVSERPVYDSTRNLTSELLAQLEKDFPNEKFKVREGKLLRRYAGLDSDIPVYCSSVVMSRIAERKSIFGTRRLEEKVLTFSAQFADETFLEFNLLRYATQNLKNILKESYLIKPTPTSPAYKSMNL
ncbi:MAG: hypothetical protein AABX59_00460 [Nanoarchaeota archaeon]